MCDRVMSCDVMFSLISQCSQRYWKLSAFLGSDHGRNNQKKAKQTVALFNGNVEGKEANMITILKALAHRISLFHN